MEESEQLRASIILSAAEGPFSSRWLLILVEQDVLDSLCGFVLFDDVSIACFRTVLFYYI